MGRHIDLSVLISTRNRARKLERTLASFQEQQLGKLTVEVLVIDNGSDDDTRNVQNSHWPGLQIVALCEPVPGKSRALNRGLEITRGNLLAFTDDDVTLSTSWLADLHNAADHFPDASFFCGSIVPCFPPETPEWLRTHPDLEGFFGKFEPQTYEGALLAPHLPFGANFAVRKSAIAEMRFNTDLGPPNTIGIPLGEDTDFMMRLRARYGECIYVPSATVFHHISPEQIEQSWLFERAYKLGRTSFFFRGKPRILSGRYQASVVNHEKSLQFQFERGALINYYCGQLYECMNSSKETPVSEELKAALKALDCDSHRDLLCLSAQSAGSEAVRV